MNVIICGAGRVGFTIAKLLMEQDHSITVIDQSSEDIQKLNESLDVRSIVGKATYPSRLEKADAEKIAEMTVNCLKENVPSTVPGIAFLSGGQTELEATKNLNTINKINNTKFIMTFSYGRALQQSALKYWSKNQEDFENTKKIFNHRSKMNSLSVKAEWSEATESKTAA